MSAGFCRFFKKKIRELEDKLLERNQEETHANKKDMKTHFNKKIFPLAVRGK